MALIFSILFLLPVSTMLGGIPELILTKKLKETEWTKQEEEGSTEEDTSPSLCFGRKGVSGQN